MITNNQRRAILVGLFVAVGIAILIAGILTLGGQKKQFVPSINVLVIFDDVSGLQLGNNIWYSGVKIGTVRRLSLHGQSRVEVLLHIEKKAQPFIRRDARAKISSDGLIGNRIVVLYDGSPGAPPVQDGDTLQQAKSLSTEDMMATLQKNNENLLHITTDFKELTRRLAEGEGTLGALFKDESLYNSLRATAQRLQKAAENSRALTDNLASYTAELQKPGSLTEELVHDTVLMPQLRDAISGLNRAVQKTDSFATNLRAVSNQLTRTDNAFGVLTNDPAAAEDIRKILNNLNSGSQKLDEDLEALQHNFLLRGFFRKKAKREQQTQANQPVENK